MKMRSIVIFFLDSWLNYRPTKDLGDVRNRTQVSPVRLNISFCHNNQRPVTRKTTNPYR